MRVASLVPFVAMLLPVAAQTQTPSKPEITTVPAQPASPCDTGAYREFDFWAGSWIVKVASGQEAAET